jgi:ankyrin repeat protein
VRNPQELFSVYLENKGIKADAISALELNGFFMQMTDENISGYDMPKAVAIRTEDIEDLRRMLREGQTLQVCNRFGESVVHSACRRSLARILQFLLQEAKVSVKVVDDYGRTPMHDACWTNRPNFDVVKILLSACPDLLLLADKRGFTPLQYVRKDLWGEWCQFLEDNKDNLMPRELVRPLR